MKTKVNRRDAIKSLGAVAAATGIGVSNPLIAAERKNYLKGSAPIKITKVKAIATYPHGLELVVVKVETSEPGLYGIGCATFRQRAHVVVAAVNNYLTQRPDFKNAGFGLERDNYMDPYTYTKATNDIFEK